MASSFRVEHPRRASVFDGRSADFLSGNADLAVRLYSNHSEKEKKNDTLYHYINLASSAKIQARIQQIHSILQKRQRWAAITAALSVALSVLINELCIFGEYTSEGYDGQPAGYPSRDCRKPVAELLKMLQLVLSGVLVCLVCLAFTTRLKLQLAEKTLKQVTEGTQMKTGVSKGRVLKLVLEIVISCAQSVPFFHRDFEVSMLGFKMYYRLESIMCGVTFLRLYHVWRWAKLKAYTTYFSLEESYALKDASSIKQLQEKHKKNEILALKVAISRDPLPIIGLGALILIFVVSYLIRLAEGPAGQAHSTYIWDQVWFVFVTLTTTGYGDITPVSHLGRAAAICIMALGPILTAFITASTTSSLALKSEEQMVMLKMDRNKRKYKVYTLAAQLVQLWWRDLKQRRGLQRRRSSQGSLFKPENTRLLYKAELLAEFRVAVEELIKFSVRTNMIPGEVAEGAEHRDAHEGGGRESIKSSPAGSGVFRTDGVEERLSCQMEQGLNDVSRALGEIHRRLDTLQVGMQRLELRIATGEDDGNVSEDTRPPSGLPPLRKKGSCSTVGFGESPTISPLITARKLESIETLDLETGEVGGDGSQKAQRSREGKENLLPRHKSRELEGRDVQDGQTRVSGQGVGLQGPRAGAADVEEVRSEADELNSRLSMNGSSALDHAADKQDRNSDRVTTEPQKSDRGSSSTVQSPLPDKMPPRTKSSGKNSPSIASGSPLQNGDGGGARSRVERGKASEAARAVLSELRESVMRSLAPSNVASLELSLLGRTEGSAVETSISPNVVATRNNQLHAGGTPAGTDREGRQVRENGQSAQSTAREKPLTDRSGSHSRKQSPRREGRESPRRGGLAGKTSPLRVKGGVVPRLRLQATEVGSISDIEQMMADVDPSTYRSEHAAKSDRRKDDGAEGRRGQVSMEGSSGERGRRAVEEVSDSQMKRKQRAEDRRRLLQVYEERRERRGEADTGNQAVNELLKRAGSTKPQSPMSPRVHSENVVVFANGTSWWEGARVSPDQFARRSREPSIPKPDPPPMQQQPRSSGGLASSATMLGAVQPLPSPAGPAHYMPGANAQASQMTVLPHSPHDSGSAPLAGPRRGSPSIAVPAPAFADLAPPPPFGAALPGTVPSLSPPPLPPTEIRFPLS